MKRLVYLYPKIGRAGLGNCLLPWARAVVRSRASSAPILAPRWVQPRLGAVLRAERIKRFYLNEFTNAGYVRGLKRAFILATFAKKRETEAEGSKPAEVNGRTIIIYEGLRNYFQDFCMHDQIIREELLKIVSPAIIEKVQPPHKPFVAMHVRRGDIVTPGFTEEQLVADRRYTPLSWFVAAAKSIRSDPRWQDLPICVVSDGWMSQLTDLLQVENCRIVTLGSAIGDILFLARASLLAASAHSTFSMWASFLGRMPTIYFPGKMDQRVFPSSSDIFEGEWHPSQTLPGPPRNAFPSQLGSLALSGF